MELSRQQIEKVKSWVDEGAGIGEVQGRISSEFGVSMTYMEVRFLLDDIDAQIRDRPEKTSGGLSAASDAGLSAAPSESSGSSESFASGQADFVSPIGGDGVAEDGGIAENLAKNPAGDPSENSADSAARSPGEGGAQNAPDGSNLGGGDGESSASGVRVSMDGSPRPGSLASGSAVFSDGAQVDWVVDMNGQLGFIAPVAGYSPPQEDIPQFQSQLQKLLGVPDGSDVDDSKIEVTVSPVQRPDSLAFGSVTFSDGTKAEWRIDRVGQLVLIPSQEDKKPPQDEIPAFQRKLSSMLRKMY